MPQNWRRTICGVHAVRDRGQLGPQQLHEGDEAAALAPGQRGGQQAEAVDAVGRAQADLDRDPPAQRVADHVGAPDAHRVQEARHLPGEPGRVVGGAGELGRGAEAGQVDRVHRVVRRQRRDRLEEARLVAAEAVDEDDVLGAACRRSASRSCRGPPRPRAPAAAAGGRSGSRKKPSKAIALSRSAARPQPARAEGVEAGERALAQLQPGLGVGADHGLGVLEGVVRTSQLSPSSSTPQPMPRSSSSIR